MIIYSEILDKQFDSVDDCINAELEFKRKEKEKEEARKEHQKKLDEAFDKAMKAFNEYLELAGFEVEETEDEIKITGTMSVEDEDADDIWDEIIALFTEM